MNEYWKRDLRNRKIGFLIAAAIVLFVIHLAMRDSDPVAVLTSIVQWPQRHRLTQACQQGDRQACRELRELNGDYQPPSKTTR